jgi:hypothetical protein
MIEAHKIGSDIFYITTLFWDCDCEENYIQPAFRDESILRGCEALALGFGDYFCVGHGFLYVTI